MTLRSLLVLLDDDPLCGQRVRTAIALARSFDAHLTGLAATGSIELPGTIFASASMAELAQAANEQLAEDARRHARAFDQECERSGLAACRSICLQGEAAAGLLQEIHGHDLAILTQADPGRTEHWARAETVERMVLFSARPTLLLPYAGTFQAPFQNVLVAWDASREADRAIADALPLLRKARRVDVVSWHESRQAADLARTSHLDVREWLARHGVSAEMHSEDAAGPIADAVLSRAADLNADLLVMGGYGHTRWTERLLGGATRGILSSMTVPVLMSR